MALELCTGGASHAGWGGGDEAPNGRNAMHQLTRPGQAQDELDFLKGCDSWKSPVGRSLALDHCGARLVLILLLMGRQVFSTVLGKKVSSDPSAAETLRTLVK